MRDLKTKLLEKVEGVEANLDIAKEELSGKFEEICLRIQAVENQYKDYEHDKIKKISELKVEVENNNNKMYNMISENLSTLMERLDTFEKNQKEMEFRLLREQNLLTWKM